MTPPSTAAKPGPPVDHAARAEAVALGDRIDASAFTFAEVFRVAGLTSVSDYNGARAALRGHKTNRPAVEKVARAFERLTEPSAP